MDNGDDDAETAAGGGSGRPCDGHALKRRTWGERSVSLARRV